MTPDAFSKLPIPFWLVFVLAIFISLVSVLIAMDARERGMSRMTAVMWFFAVQMFAPVALLYLFIRKNIIAAKAAATARVVRSVCPYCNEPIDPGARLCRSCQRLL